MRSTSLYWKLNLFVIFNTKNCWGNVEDREITGNFYLDQNVALLLQYCP